MLFTADDLALDAVFSHRFAELIGNALEDLSLATLALLQRVFEHAVAIGVQVLEAEVLELHFQTVDAKSVRDRRVDIDGLARDAFLLRSRHRAQGLHVVQAIGELHEDHANVLDHRQHHLAEALRLRLGTAAKLDLIQFADAIDD